MSKPDKCKNSDYGNGKLDWQNCGVCGGRIHEEDCKSKKVKGKDCLGDHTDKEYKDAGYG